MLQEHFAILREADAAAVAFDQLGADRRFQLAQRLGHRRLADMQHFGGAADALLSRDLDQRAQMPEFDRNISHTDNSWVMISRIYHFTKPNRCSECTAGWAA